MPLVVRVGDINSAGGQAIAGHSNILVNYIPAAIQGSPVTPHPCCGAPGCGIHCAANAACTGKPTVLMNGIPTLQTGDVDTCGHVRATGSNNTIVL